MESTATKQCEIGDLADFNRFFSVKEMCSLQEGYPGVGSEVELRIREIVTETVAVTVCRTILVIVS